MVCISTTQHHDLQHTSFGLGLVGEDSIRYEKALVTDRLCFFSLSCLPWHKKLLVFCEPVASAPPRVFVLLCPL